MVRVLPDVAAIDREFDYLVPASLEASSAVPIEVGTLVRVPLHGRRVGGWITAVDVEPPPGVRLLEVKRISGVGPDADMVDLCRWAAWRWAGRHATLLSTASPRHKVATLRRRPLRAVPPSTVLDPRATTAFEGTRAVVRVPPQADLYPYARAAAALGDALIVCPSVAQASDLAVRLRRGGIAVALLPRDWALAAGGGHTVVGTRPAAFAPCPDLAAVLVVDEHDEMLQNESSPTWHAREVLLERARRRRVPAVMTAPVPTLEARSRSPVILAGRAEERAGWPVVEVIDRRPDDMARTGLYSTAVVRAVRSRLDMGEQAGTVLCVLNRTGRASLLGCARCGELTRCEDCRGPLEETDERVLRCRRCGKVRPVVCQACGHVLLRKLRIGVSRAREEIASLLGEEVDAVTASTPMDAPPVTRVVIGTEAVLHRVPRASMVVFLEFDQELMVPRFRAGEQALALLARAARVLARPADVELEAGRVADAVDGPRGTGTIVVQTRDPDHPVIRAAVRADPDIFTSGDSAIREILRLPPFTTTARIAGAAAAAFVEQLTVPPGVELHHRGGDEWLVVAEDRIALLDLLAGAHRPPGRLRLQVDPLRAR